MLCRAKTRQSRKVLVLFFCLGIALALAFATAPATPFVANPAYADTPVTQSASASAEESAAQSQSTQDNREASTVEAQKGTDKDSDDARPAANSELAGPDANVVLQVVATILCLGLVATFFFFVLRKTNRHISDMDNMFK